MAENLLDTIRNFAKRQGSSPNPPKLMPQEDKSPTKETAWKQDRQKGWLREPLAPAVEFAASLLGGIGTALSTYSPDANAMIHKGGRTDLNMTHEGSVERLLNLLRGRGHISSPSVAVSANDAFPFRQIRDTQNASLILNPASHRFDPKYNPANLLVNRDAYVTRQRSVPPEVRLGASDDLRLTEGGTGDNIQKIYDSVANSNLPGAQQILAILASPRFRDFAQYEKLPSGAKTLSKQAPTTATYGMAEEELKRSYPNLVSQINNSRTPVMDAQGFLEQLQKRAETTNKLPKSEFFKTENIAGQSDSILWDILRNSASDYAELKVAGEVPLDSRTVSAVMLSPYSTVLDNVPNLGGYDPKRKARDSLRQAAEAKGLRVGTPEELMPADMQMTYMDIAEQLSRIMIKERERGVGAFEIGKNLPEVATKYLPEGMIDLATEDALHTKSLSKTYEALLPSIKRSKQYAADTASILTARDMDAVSTENILKLLKEQSQ